MAETAIYLDINEGAEYIGQPVSALRTGVKTKRLRHIRRGYGGKLWFKREWLKDYMDSLEATDGEVASA